jgi:ribosomal protein L37AE/L43A
MAKKAPAKEQSEKFYRVLGEIICPECRKEIVKRFDGKKKVCKKHGCKLETTEYKYPAEWHTVSGSNAEWSIKLAIIDKTKAKTK